MKPKFNQFLRHLPVTMFISASLPIIAQAAIVDDDFDGNVNVVTSGANTIRANGPNALSTNTNPLVNIIAGVTLTGDAGETEVLEITAANYTVTNFGTLAGSSHEGINSTFAFTLNNSGTISAAGNQEGINSVGSTGSVNTSITNNVGGSITGTDDAIYFNTNGGIVINNGTIDGITGGNSDGIDALSGVAITNNNGGLIRGLHHGIDVSDTLNLTITSVPRSLVSMTMQLWLTTMA